MKCFRKRKFVLCALTCNFTFVIVLYYFLQTERIIDTVKKIDPTYSVVIREFEDYDNDVPQTVRHIHEVLGNHVPIFIVTDHPTYPKIDFISNHKVQAMFILDFDLDSKKHTDDEVLDAITTDFVIFIPDGARIYNKSVFERLIHDFDNSKFAHAFAVKTGRDKLRCPGMHINLQRWRLKITEFEGYEGLCDYIEGDQAVLLHTVILAELPSPWSIPLTKSLYLQFVVKRWKSFVYTPEVFIPRKGFKDPSSMQRFKHEEEKREDKLFRKFKIKELVNKIDADHEKSHYYGCSKGTERCYSSVINNIPDFLYHGKWTPPCCLKALRETAQHVFKIFDSTNVRYWLEGGSLLGAARSGDIIPWDTSVDIGIYKEDIQKCKELVKTGNYEYVDEKGFLWEIAEEGDFYRVHYSRVNRNYIQIFPFYSKNGVMTKDYWFKTHKQDIEFPEHFLVPLSSIDFIGRNVSAPNDVKEFLELKFGKGAIENHQYPNGEPVY
ncbi:ribitol 5-phosphate transferase FKRP-like [Saccostrea echinata]|uniref:ribitol 5-phosphate transferase FKRP-like n=1 Tax=Saccostrea echinata TaxID=191078 RepID=UPI002A81CF9E|nr:ribitol 5-phosphate transferase FKRP-like [Saccostrea echinata]